MHGPYACDRCGKTYKLKSSLQNHKSSHREDTHCCPECKTSFKYISGLRKHMKVCSSTDRPRCSYCKKEFKYIKEHERYCDSNPKRSTEQHVCTLCKSSFRRQRYLTAHMGYAHGNKQYTCEKCPMRFVHRKAYNIHRGKCTAKK